MNKKKAVFFLGLIIGFIGIFYYVEQFHQGKEEETNRYTATFLDVFDTRTEIIGYGNSEEEFQSQVELLKEKLVSYHQMFDIYHNYDGISNLKTINDAAGKQPVVVDDEIIELLQFCIDMYEKSEGQVNIAMGSVLSIWHEYREEGMEDPEKASIPKKSQLEQAAKNTNIDYVKIDEEKNTVFLEKSNMSLDVGGIGKGYAVQKTAEYAKEIGMDSLLISVGGNVCAVGGKKDGSPWTVGIQNPDLSGAEKYKEKVKVKDKSVVTSGNYQRYYMVDGVRYCHIIDPDTWMPADDFASVTILSEDSGFADAMSTAVYNMSLEEGMEFVDQMDEIEAMWVLEDGSVRYSGNFKQFLAE